MARDYEKELKWQASPEQKKRRAQRNAARREAMRKGLVRKGDNLEVDHVGKNRKGPLNNSKVRVITREKNRRKQPKRDGSDD